MSGGVEKLNAAQRTALARLSPDDVSRDDYAPFEGRSHGLFRVAPGWGRLELSRAGLSARAAILRARSAGEGGA